MVRFFVSAEDLKKEDVSLTGENAQHRKKLLRASMTWLRMAQEWRKSVLQRLR